MKPDQPIQPTNLVESPTTSEENLPDKSAEVVASPEVFVASGPAADPTVIADEPATLSVIPDEEVSKEFITEETPIKEIDDTAVLSGDSQYFSAVKKIIKEDAEKPYKEEEDSEELQKGYLKERFGVDVDIDEENN